MTGDLDALLRELEARPGAARAAIVEELLRRGCPEEEIRKAHRNGRLALLPLECALRDEGSKTPEEIAAEHGVDLDELIATRRALGLHAEAGAPVYGDALAEHARRLRFARDVGMPLEALMGINRVVARTMPRIAAASRDATLALLADEVADESQRALRAAEAAEELAPQFERVLAYVYA
jgi:Adenylate cyclase regulatory domain